MSRTVVFAAAVTFVILFSGIQAQDDDDKVGCFVEGECLDSLLLTEISAETPEDCLVLCQGYVFAGDNDACQYFTHFADSEACYLYGTCDSLDSSDCDDCISGRDDCTQTPCFIEGLSCVGIEVGHDEDVDNSEDCLALCDELSSDGCVWATFYGDDGVCTLTQDCQAVQLCSDCTIASIENENCNVGDGGGGGGSDEFVVAIMGGYNGRDGNMASVETLQPNPPEDGEQDCADLPFAANQMFGFADGEGRPVACGGFGNPVPRDCFTSIDGEWVNTYSTYVDRSGEGSAAQLADGRAFIIGGPGLSSEIFDPEEDAIAEGPDLPYIADVACVLEVPGQPGVVFIAGSSADTDKAYLFDIDSGRTVEDLRLPNPRYQLACGAVETASGDYEILVAGGDNYDDVVDILSLDTMTWRPGTRLPIGLWSPEAVTFRNDDGRITFLLMGGEATVTDASSFVYEYDPLTEQWILRPDLVLKEARGYFATALVRADAFNCYDS